MDPTDGFILFVFTVIISISFVFGLTCSTFIQHKRDENDKKKLPTEGLFQIKGKDHAQVHLYSDCSRARGCEMTALESCSKCNSVIRVSDFCSICTTRREKSKKTK